MPVVNFKQPTETISVPVPTPVQSNPKQRPPAVVQQQPRPQTPQNLPLTFGGEQDEMGNHHTLSAVILPWVPQQHKLSRTKPIRYSGSTTEEDFHRLLDANPDDHHTRMVFADWLQDRNDPRSEGYRALGQLQRNPIQSQHSSDTWVWGNKKNSSYHYGPNGTLPDPWIKRTKNNHPRYGGSPIIDPNSNWRYYTSRREAEDAAALAFNKLPTRFKNQILKPKQLSRKRVVIRYTRPNLTSTQKERAKRVELVVLPKNIEGKKCGTCRYAKKHSKESVNLYCTNNAVHMNVKSNWACKLWEGKGVKRLQRKRVSFTK